MFDGLANREQLCLILCRLIRILSDAAFGHVCAEWINYYTQEIKLPAV